MSAAPRKINKCEFVNSMQQRIQPGDAVVFIVNGYSLGIKKGIYLGCTPSGRVIVRSKSRYRGNDTYTYLWNNEVYIFSNVAHRDPDYKDTDS